jgi:hypothetical protein
MTMLRPDPQASVTPPCEPWLDKSDSLFASADPDLTDCASYIESSVVFVPALNSLNKINDMISEDCGHLLRKAQKSINNM